MGKLFGPERVEIESLIMTGVSRFAKGMGQNIVPASYALVTSTVSLGYLLCITHSIHHPDLQQLVERRIGLGDAARPLHVFGVETLDKGLKMHGYQDRYWLNWAKVKPPPWK